MPLEGSGKRIVLDTNIFISGIFWRGDSYKIMKLSGESKVYVIISRDILDELYKVLLKFKIQLSEAAINKHITLIKENSMIVEPTEKFFIVEDPTDNKFIDCAVCGNASYIITNDKHLLKIKQFKNVKILTPKDFLLLP